MLPTKPIIYSTQVMTLRQLIYQQAIRESSTHSGEFNYEALGNLIVSRTSLTPQEAGDLTGEETRAVYALVCDGILTSVKLAVLSEQLDGEDTND